MTCRQDDAYGICTDDEEAVREWFEKEKWRRFPKPMLPQDYKATVAAINSVLIFVSLVRLTTS